MTEALQTLIEGLTQLAHRVQVLESLETPVVSGGGAGAPANATYLTLEAEAVLSAERRLVPAARLVGTDAGPNSTYTLDLATSGVAAGAYGSATQSGTFTVDAYGRLTAAANVAISGVAPSAHNLLSAFHGDTVANAATRGSLLYGNATPAWDELVLGGISGSVLTRDATDALWSTFALAGTAGQTYTFPAASGSVPTGAGTLTVSSVNDVTLAAHTHAITSSSNPGAAASILASNASGHLRLERLGCGVAPIYPLDVTGNAIRITGSPAPGTFIVNDMVSAFSRDQGNLEIQMSTFRDAASACFFRMTKARGTRAVPTLTGADTQIGGFIFRGWDGVTNQNAAQITGSTDSAPAAGSMPGKITLATTPSGSVGVVTHVTLRDTGLLGIGTPNPAAKCHVTGVGDIQQLLVTGHTTQAVATPLVGFTRNDTAAGVAKLLGLTGLGSGADLDGVSIDLYAKSSTDPAIQQARIYSQWAAGGGATHATRKAQLVGTAWDTAEREGWRIGASGSAPMLSFYGGTPVVRGAALTTQLTTITHTAPGAPDYAIQDFLDVSGGAGWAFASQDEANTVLSVIANLQVRLGELEARLNAATGVNLIA